MKKTALILTILFTSLTGFSQTFIDGNFTYDILTPTTVSLADYDVATGGTDVVIPASVIYNSVTYNLSHIGYQSFMSKNITSVIIPDGVEVIVNAAFLFNNLTTVVIPNSVTGIGGAAFGSNSLTSVIIGDNVTIISDNAFNGNQLTSITLPIGVTSINKQVFANNNFANVVIPSWITFIGEGAFGTNPMVSVLSEGTTPASITTALGIADSFAEDRSNIDLIIPAGTVGLYVTNVGAEWTGFKSVTESAVGLSENYLDSDFRIYPNPVISQLKIDSEEKIETIVITDAVGKAVETIIKPNNTIDVSHLTTGVYFLQLHTLKGLISKRIIKK